MIAEDTYAAHASSADTTSIEWSDLFHDHHSQNNSTAPCDAGSHRDSSHFGHCSFLLIHPMTSHHAQFLLTAHQTLYFFSLKMGDPQLFLKPPIKA